MNRDDAERVFALVGRLHGELHDRLVPDRWWLVWTLMGFEILVTNTLTHVMIARGITRPLPHFALFFTQVIALAATIRIAQRHGGGVRTQREAFIWWIWTTFLIAAAVSVTMNILLGLPMFALACVLPLLAAMSFSVMGMAVERGFVFAAAAFVLCAIAMAAFPAVQFLIYAAAWFVVLETYGYLHYPRAAAAGRAL